MIIEKRKLSELNAAPYNPRQSTAKQEKQLKASLEKFGLVEPVIYNKRTGYIVGGHFRVRELQKLGCKEIDCVIVDLNDEDDQMLIARVLNAYWGYNPTECPENVLYFESHPKSPNRGVFKESQIWRKYRHKFYFGE